MNRIHLLGRTLVRQTPIAVLFALGAVFSLAVPDITVTSMPEFVASMIVAAIATALSFVRVTSRTGTLLFSIVPAIDFAAIALLRSSTGAGASVFTSMVVLPVFWLASSEGIRFVVYAVAGSVVVILAPLALQPGSTLGQSEYVRLGVSIIVFATVALVVNALSAQSRLKVRDAQEREVLVNEEIDRAAAVQRSLLPDTSTALADHLSVAGRCLPAKTVGGDFFDWYSTHDGIAITLGDVMGKGVGAGLIAAAVRASLRSAHAVDDPAEALLRASDGLEAANATNVTFTTLFHARLTNDGVLRWADAGHGLSAIIRSNGDIEHLASPNLPLGLQLGEHWETTTTRLEVGDALISISDGVLDLWDTPEAAVDGMDALARRHSDPATLVAALTAIAARVPHDDDVTIVAVRREPVVA